MMNTPTPPLTDSPAAAGASMLANSYVPLGKRDLPVNVIINFPVYAKSDGHFQLLWLPGTLLYDPQRQMGERPKVYVQNRHVPYVSFYQDCEYWAYPNRDDFDRFTLDYLCAVLFRVFYFKKIDNYTFISLYDFIDRFRYSWLEDLTPRVIQWVSASSEWAPAFRYRVFTAYGCLLTARKMGYTAFYDLVDFFLGGLLCDIGHFAPYGDVAEFLAARPDDWFYEHKHPLTSMEMVKEIEDLGLTVRQMCERHHEHVDGSGFPAQAQGAAAVPEHAQIAGLMSELMYAVIAARAGATIEDAARDAKPDILKNRPAYTADAFSVFTDVMNTMF